MKRIQPYLRRKAARPASAGRLARIRVVAMDVDGVLTDGGMYYSARGEAMKKFNARDGKAIELLRKAGFTLALITGEDSAIVRARARKLRIADVYTDCKDKVKAAQHLLDRYGYTFAQMLFVGDDHGDRQLLARCGVSCCPQDATAWVYDRVDLIIPRNGGCGVIAELAHALLEGRV